MNKNDLVSAVAEHSGLSKTDAGRAVDSVFGSIEGALKAGDEVRIVGFGSFLLHIVRQALVATHARVKPFKLRRQSSLNSRQAHH